MCSTSHGVCVNATDYEYPLEAKGASPSPGGVDNTIAGNPEYLELDTNPEGSGELLGVQCWEAQEEKPGSQILDVQTKSEFLATHPASPGMDSNRATAVSTRPL